MAHSGKRIKTEKPLTPIDFLNERVNRIRAPIGKEIHLFLPAFGLSWLRASNLYVFIFLPSFENPSAHDCASRGKSSFRVR